MLKQSDFGKIYQVDNGIHCTYLKVDETGNIGYCTGKPSDGPYTWEDKKWCCGRHQHWDHHDFNKFKVVFELNLCLENK